MSKIYQTIVKILFKLTVYYLRGNVNVQFWNTLLKGRFIMSVYIITGGTTGIGAAVRTTLLDQGHEVFNIDLKEGDFLADLSKS